MITTGELGRRPRTGAGLARGRKGTPIEPTQLFPLPWLMLLLTLGCGGNGASEEAEPEAPAIACVAPTETVIEDVRELSGVVDTPLGAHAHVAAEIAGRIASIPVHEGDHVEAGALLAVLDAGPLVDAARAARAHALEVDIAARNARVTRDRAAHLVERGIAAGRDLDDSESRLGELEAARAAASALSSEASRNAARARVVAPFAGVVVRVLRQEGETVDGTPLTPIIELANLEELELIAVAAPRDLVALSLGSSAELFFDGLDAPIEGRVSNLAAALDPVTGTGRVRVTVLGSPSLPLGLAGRAVIRVGEHDALLAPEAAVRGRRDGAMEVLVCVDGAAVARSVESGAHHPGGVEITSGLTAGEWIVARALGIDEGNPVVLPGNSP